MPYEIVRFRFKTENEVIKVVETLREAQDHCDGEDTHGDGWFDGYRRIEDQEMDRLDSRTA